MRLQFAHAYTDPRTLPRRDQGLRALIDHEGIELETALIWLDDLDKHLARALDPDLLRRLVDEHPSVVVVATMRRSQLQDRQEALADPAWELLTDQKIVNRVELQAALTPTELQVADTQFANPALRAALQRGVGLGEYLVGGPELVKRLELATGFNRHLATTVVDWYRTGLKTPLPEPELQQLWTQTLPDTLAVAYRRLTPTEQHQRFATARDWSSTAIMSRDAYEVALVTGRVDGYEANDYVVDHVSKQTDTPAIPNAIWDAALTVAACGDTSRHERLWTVGSASYNQAQRDIALRAMTTLANDGIIVAAINVGVLLGELGRSEDELAVYDEVIARYGDEPEPALREQAASALVNKGFRLGALGRSEEAVAVYDEVIARYGDEPEPALREQAAKALVNKGFRLGALGRSEEAVAVYDEVIARYSHDPALREVVTAALSARSAVGN